MSIYIGAVKPPAMLKDIPEGEIVKIGENAGTSMVEYVAHKVKDIYIGAKPSKKRLGDIEVGKTVTITDVGGLAEYYVVQHKYFPEKNINRTLLLRKNCISRARMNNAIDAGNYTGSEIESYLNNSFYDSLPETIRDYLGQTIYKVHSNDGSTVTTILASNHVFLLSAKELGYGSSDDGVTVPYPELYTKGWKTMSDATYTWTRSINPDAPFPMVYKDDGTFTSVAETDFCNVRPAFTLPDYLTVYPDNSLVPSERLDSKYIGDTVKILEDGDYVDFLVVHKGLPENGEVTYDGSCDGVWLLRKGLWTTSIYGGAYTDYGADYTQSEIFDLLHNDYVNTRLAPKVATYLRDHQVKIPYVNVQFDADANGTVNDGDQGFPCAAFVLSSTEAGLGDNIDTPLNMDGNILDYFMNTPNDQPCEERIAEGIDAGVDFPVPLPWWLRSTRIATPTEVGMVDKDGSIKTCDMGESNHIRPAFILPLGAEVKNGIVTGNMSCPDTETVTAHKVKKVYVGVKTDVPIYKEEVKTQSLTNLNINEFFDIQNGTYAFLWNPERNGFVSNNKGVHNSTAATLMTAKFNMTNLKIRVFGGSEANYDFFQAFRLNAGSTTPIELTNKLSGNVTNGDFTIDKLSEGDKLRFEYTKESGGSSYDDEYVVQFESVTANIKTQIGTEQKDLAKLCYVKGDFQFYIGEYSTGVTKEYESDANMTWEQWVNSSYNTDGFYISSDKIYHPNSKNAIYEDGGGIPCKPSDIISPNGSYIDSSRGGSGGNN